MDYCEIMENLAGLSDAEIDNLADGFARQTPAKAERLATVINWSLQDQQIRKEETMLKEAMSKTSGTHLQGKFIMPYDALLTAFGEPHYKFDRETDIENKIDVEWAWELPSGKIATVYNWKDGEAYCGKDGLPVHLLTSWHVGGLEMDAMHELVDIINKRLDDANYSHQWVDSVDG